jgi:hypothetical protein
MVRFKALKTFHAYNLPHAVEGEIYEVELDDHTKTNWTENGLIEEVKTSLSKKAVKADENQ